MGDNFVYLNVNPLGLIEQDCVVRAISLGTGKDYQTVIDLLVQTGYEHKCETLCVCCYSNLIENHFKFKRVEVENQTAKELAKIHPYGIFLIRMSGHLSCMINGKVMDIWDCSEEPITDCWRVDS